MMPVTIAQLRATTTVDLMTAAARAGPRPHQGLRTRPP